MLSDESSSDSDNGIRFKTDSTRRQNTNRDTIPGERGQGRGRDNWRGAGPGRSRPGGCPRPDFRRTSPRPRERSPFRDKNRNFNDRHMREGDHHRHYDRRDDNKARNDRNERNDRNDRSDRNERNDRSERNDRIDRNDRNGRSDFNRQPSNVDDKPSQRRYERSDRLSDRNISLTRESERRKDDHKRSRDSRERKERSTSKQEERSTSKQEERSTNKQEERSTSKQEERSTSKQEERSTSKQEERSTSKQEERSTSKQEDVKSRLKIDDIKSKDDLKINERLVKSPAHSSKGNSHHAESDKAHKIVKESSVTVKAKGKSPIRFRKSPSLERGTKRKSTDNSVGKKDRKLQDDSKFKETTEVQRKDDWASDKSVDSDAELKPISYYNMLSNEIDMLNSPSKAVSETIAVLDSSDDEIALRKKLLLVELKKVKEKKKSKHKKPKKSGHKKSRSESDSDGKSENLIDESLTMKVTIDTTLKKSSLERRVVSNSSRQKDDVSEEEEGEITKEDGEKVMIDTSDLRHRLARQIGPSLPSASLSASTVSSSSSSKGLDLRDKLSSRAVDGVEGVSGPALPPHMRKDVEGADGYAPEGPALPPHLTKRSSYKSLGPSLPPDMRRKLAEHDRSSRDRGSSHHSQEALGEEDGDTDLVGPLPPGMEPKGAHRRLEERALRLRIGALEGRGEDKGRDGREEWMLELPDAKAKNLGLGPRQFRARAAPDMSDRSSWTDTPHQKVLKAAGLPTEDTDDNLKKQMEIEAELRYIEQRDAEQEQAARKHKKKSKRNESLVDMHQKKLEKKRKKEERETGVPSRRPFDRDIDLKANKFDESQKKSMMKKAQLLDTRFSSGQSKFL